MENTTKLLKEWAIKKIKTEYPDDIALLIAVDGISVNGDDYGEYFDYFVPSTERGYELAQSFIIGGISRILGPRTWETLERAASFDTVETISLGNARILYSRSKEDEERFEVIKRKLFDNLSNPEFTYKTALKNLYLAMDLYKNMIFEEQLSKLRVHARLIFYYLSISVAVLNRTYCDHRRAGIISIIEKLDRLPDCFEEYYHSILATSKADELKRISFLLIDSVRKFVSGYKPKVVKAKKDTNCAQLAVWYQQFCSTWTRIYYYCEINDSNAAFVEASVLQEHLDIASEEFSLDAMDLIGNFDVRNLELLSNCAAKLEKNIISAIKDQNCKIERYDTAEEFLSDWEIPDILQRKAE